MKKLVKNILRRLQWNGTTRYFCISMQRTGTTSVGQFLQKNGIPTAVWSVSHSEKWSKHWYNKEYDKIFKSFTFLSYQAFEDNPWWYPEFYKTLYNKYPKAKFILFTRDSERWFQSMVNHSNGKNPGNTKIHSVIYQREKEYNELVNNLKDYDSDNLDNIDNLLDLKGHKDHYIKIYEQRNKKIISFFNENDSYRLFHCQLEDENKWEKLALFIGVPYQGEEIHENKSE